MNRRRILGGIIAFVGFQLSPFTMWNDWCVEFPICWGLATAVSFFHEGIFTPVFVGLYWLLNIGGCFLIGKGARLMVDKDHIKKANKKKVFFRNIIISSVATIIIMIVSSLDIQVGTITKYLNFKNILVVK